VRRFIAVMRIRLSVPCKLTMISKKSGLVALDTQLVVGGSVARSDGFARDLQLLGPPNQENRQQTQIGPNGREYSTLVPSNLLH
jgi:hypothetical protein